MNSDNTLKSIEGIKSIKAIIFDMDGVIFDSEQVYYDSFFITAKKFNIHAEPEFVRSFAGKSSLVCELMLQNFLSNDMQKTEQFFQVWGAERRKILVEKGLGFKLGFLNLIKIIKTNNLLVGLVTSANSNDMTANFARNDSSVLDYFSHIITVEDVRYPKPNPEPYEKMMKLLSVKPSETIIIEDSDSGINAALASKANTIMISETTSLGDEIESQLLLKVSTHQQIINFLQNNGVI